MDLLKALHKIKHGLSESSNKDNCKFKKFEDILLNAPEISSSDACQLLYGNKGKTNEFRVMKHRYEQKLKDEICRLSSSSKNLDNFSLRPLVAEKNNLIISSLYKNGYQKEAVSLAEKNLTFCKENYITDSSITLTGILINYYSFIAPNNIILNTLLNENEQLIRKYAAELKAFRYNAIISNWYVLAKGAFNFKKIEEIKRMLDEIEELKIIHISWSIHFFYYSIANFYYILTGNFQHSLKVALNGIQESETHFMNDKMMKYRCKINVGLSYFYLKDYCNASSYYKNALSLVPEGHRLWFEDGLNYFTILLRGNLYDELYSLYSSRINHKNLKKFSIIEEQWKIREAFIVFLIEADILEKQNYVKIENSKFNVNKFLNSVSFYTKDKAGLHILIIILKILFLLLKEKYNEIEVLTDSLNQYLYKYLNKKETMRSFYFIKLLILMANSGFHPVRVKAHAKITYSKLTSLNFTLDEKSNMIEILPYEQIWEIIIKLLYKNISK